MTTDEINSNQHLSNNSNNYSGSQAQSTITMVHENINPNTGSLNLQIPLLKIPGQNGFDLNLEILFAHNKLGTFGLAIGWQYNISFVIPGQSLTFNFQTYILDAEWTDSNGYQSGLRYLNDHSIKFQQIIPAKELAYDTRLAYAYLLTYANGCHEYFDALGKLLARDDRFGNHILYYYQQQHLAGAYDGILKMLVDSYGQKILVQYLDSQIEFLLANGSKQTLNYSAAGIHSFTDAAGYITEVEYAHFSEYYLPFKVSYPSGLQTLISYVPLNCWYSAAKLPKLIPVIQQIQHLDRRSNKLLDTTKYSYGTLSAGHNFSGYPNYALGDESDSLMDSNNREFLYDVSIQQLDLLTYESKESQIFYNYLHLPVRETVIIKSGQNIATPVYQIETSYYIDPDLHARTANYTKPAAIAQYNYLADGSSRLIMQKKMTYDLFGHLTQAELWQFNPLSQDLIQVNSEKYTYYTAEPYYGLPKEIQKNDHLAHTIYLETYTLTEDAKNIARKTRTFSVANGLSETKTLEFNYDQFGQVTQSLLSSTGDKFIKTTYTYGHDLDQLKTTKAITDDRSNTTTYISDSILGVIIQAILPSQATTIYVYDQIGRQLQEISPEGLVRTQQHQVWQTNGRNASIINSPGAYIQCQEYDGLWRPTNCFENSSENPNLVNIQSEAKSYNQLGQIERVTNRLGQTLEYGHDGLNRLIWQVDNFGNRYEYKYSNHELSMKETLNGQDITHNQFNALGQVILKTIFPFEQNPGGDHYVLREKYTYDQFGHPLLVVNEQISNSTVKTLFHINYTYTAEAKVWLSEFGGEDEIKTRQAYTYDLLDNRISLSKSVHYPDNREYQLTREQKLFDGIGNLIRVFNQQGQVKEFRYDQDNKLIAELGYDQRLIKYVYNRDGLLILKEYPDIQYAYEYNQDGSLIAVSDNFGQTIRYKLNLNQSIAVCIYPDGKQVTYSYDVTTGQLSECTDAYGNKSTYQYDSYGQISELQNAEDKVLYHYYYTQTGPDQNLCYGKIQYLSISGVYQNTYKYDCWGNLTTIAHQALCGEDIGKLILQQQQHFDEHNRLQQLHLFSDLTTSVKVNSNQYFKYDSLNQLIKSQISPNSPQINDSYTANTIFNYDGNYNVIHESVNEIQSEFKYNQLDQRADLSYDPAGRLLSPEFGTNYEYNSQDQLLRVLKPDLEIKYAYYPDGSLALRQVYDRQGTLLHQERNYYNQGHQVINIRENEQIIHSYLLGLSSYASYPSERLANYTQEE